MELIMLASLWGFSFFGYNFGPANSQLSEIEYNYYVPDGSDHYVTDGGDLYQVASR